MEFKKYPKVRAFGLDGTEDILLGDIVVQPKVDGSNVSIYVYPGEPTRLARRNGFIEFGARQFQPFIDWAATQEHIFEDLRNSVAHGSNGYIFYGEFTNNQNKLKYERRSPFILFDILEDDGTHDSQEDWEGPRGEFMGYGAVRATAIQYGWDYIPAIYEGPGSEWTYEKLGELVDRESFLGGCREEGIVVKRYGELTRYHRVYFVKMVADDFKEAIRQKSPHNVIGEEIGIWIADSFLTPARVSKGIQRLKEDGEWNDENTKSNIGKLIGVVSKDIKEEHWEDICEYSAKMAWKSGSKKIAPRIAPMLEEMAREEQEHWEATVGNYEDAI